MLALCVGAVFMAAVFLFFLQAWCVWLHWYFCGLFLYFILLDGFLVNLTNGFKILQLYFCLWLLMKINCSLPAVTADLRPPLRPWLAG